MSTLSKGIKSGELRLSVAKHITVGDIFLDHSIVLRTHVSDGLVHIRVGDVDKQGRCHNVVTMQHHPDHRLVLLTPEQYDKERKKYGFYVHPYKSEF